jgi:hypothetical protein
MFDAIGFQGGRGILNRRSAGETPRVATTLVFR